MVRTKQQARKNKRPKMTPSKLRYRALQSERRQHMHLSRAHTSRPVTHEPAVKPMEMPSTSDLPPPTTPPPALLEEDTKNTEDTEDTEDT